MPRFARILASAVLAVTLSGGVGAAAIAVQPVTPVAPVTASVETQHGYDLSPGPILAHKYHFKSEFLGTIAVGGRLGWCYDYGRQSPDGSWSSGPAAGLAGRDRERITWLANRYWADALVSNRSAAALKAAINRLASAEFRSDWAGYVNQLRTRDAGVAPLSDRMLAESAAAGPVSVRAAFASKPLPGGSGSVAVTVLGNGRPLDGQAVSIAFTGASGSATRTTGAAGAASFAFTRTGVGSVSYRVTVVSPEWRRAVFSVPTSRSRQHLIRGGLTVTSTAAASYDSTLSLTVSQECGTVCDGHPPVTFSGSASGVPVQWRASVGPKIVATLDLAPGKTGSKTFAATDAQTIAFAYRVRSGGKWSAWRTGKSFAVACPPWPSVTVVKHCACLAAGSISYTFTAPAGSRSYTVALDVDGAVQSRTLTAGQSGTFAAPLPPGAKVVASFVARDSAGTQLSTGVLDSFTQSA